MKRVGISLLCFLSMGCSHSPRRPAPALSERIDLKRFMGDWRVIASIPLLIEKESTNAVESYRLDERGRIPTVYTFNKGSLTGPQKVYRSVATVKNTQTQAEWRVQFVWPFKAVYLIHYVDANYTTTIVGGAKKKHVWIMARSPHISEATYAELVRRAADLGYDVSKLRRVPQP